MSSPVGTDPHATPTTSSTNIPPLPEGATPDEKDQHWYKHVYQGDRMPQLTVRAVLIGGFLGMAMAASNLYTTLAIGWSFGVAITACVLSFVSWNVVRALSAGRVSQMSILENACMASTASAAGYSTGSTIATMFGALVLLAVVPEGKTLADIKTWEVSPWWLVAAFTLCTGLMGVFLAIPMKRQMINHEQLAFPTGSAAAETLKSLYSQSVESIRKAYALVVALVGGLLIGFLRAPEEVLEAVNFLRRFFEWFREKLFNIQIPTEIKLHFIDKLYPGGRHPYGFAFEPSVLLIAAGMIVGMRTSLTLVLSSLLLYGVVGPQIAKMDADHLAHGAETVMLAVNESAVAAPSPAEAVTASIAAITRTATELDLPYPDRLTAIARTTGDNAAAATDATAANVGKAIAGAVAAGAADQYANKNAYRASDEVRAKALAEGKPETEAAAAAKVVYDEGKYKTSLIWNWGGGTIVMARWALWGGTACMVFASLASVALQYKTIARAFIGSRAGAHSGADLSSIEVPGRWMIYGMIPITIAMVVIQIVAFEVAWWAGIIAVAMSFLLSMVGARATGETDTTPVGAMGKVMQLLFAIIAPGNINANLASAGIAANSASSSADLLQDLKTGYLLGANPRKQFIAQFCGVFFGTVAIVPIWFLMVPTREALEKFPLPATRSWEAVARVLTDGVGNLPQSALIAILIGAGLGVLLPIIEKLTPAKGRKYLPSVSALGLAWVLPFQNAFSFFIGAVIILLWTRINKRTADQYNVPVASGLIAGESLMLAALAIVTTVVSLMK
jgi:uncharacterized oligopeptide transporter (OPT) family protein